MKFLMKFSFILMIIFTFVNGDPLFAQSKKKNYNKKDEVVLEPKEQEVTTKENVYQNGNSNYNSIPQKNSSYKISKYSKEDPTINTVQAFLDSASSISSSNPGKAYDYVEQALWQSISGKYTVGEILSYKQLGTINYNLKVYDISEANFNKAIKLMQTSFIERNYSTIFELNGKSLREQGKSDEALTSFNKYLNLSRVNGDSSGVILAKSDIGSVYALQKKYGEATTQYLYVLNAEKKNNNKNGMISAESRLGGLYFGQGRISDALSHYNQGLALAKEVGDIKIVNELTDDISEVYRQQKRVNDELNLRQNTQQYSLSNGDNTASNDQNLKIADIYLKNNRTNDAVNILNTTANFTITAPPGNTVDQNQQINNDILQERGQALKTLSEVYLKQGNYQKALDNYKIYMNVVDSLQRQKAQTEYVEKQVSDELFRKQLKIDMLEKERGLGEKTIDLLRKDDEVKEQHMTNQTLLIYMMGFGILAVIITSFLVYRGSRQKKIASELLALQGLRSQMNPHFIFNALNSVNHYIAGNDERKANKYLSEFSRLMRSVMENSQKDFIPLSTEIEILELYLGLEHARFSDKFDYEFTVDENIDREQFYLPPMLLQPYIENAVWHGLRYRETKGKLSVSIKIVANGLKIVIEDDGIGRQKSKELKTVNQMKNKSIGMHNTESRLKLINGLFNTHILIDVRDANADGSGTHVEISIPSSATETKEIKKS